MSKEVGLARQTIDKYFAILENTYICKFVQPYFTNKNKEIVKMGKVYFYDVGLRNRIINDFRSLDDRIDAGAIIENAVFSNLLKRVESSSNIKFWRMKYGVEVDFIIDEQEVLPIEIKLKETDSVSTGISSFFNNYSVKTAIIANKRIFSDHKNIKFIPFYTV